MSSGSLNQLPAELLRQICGYLPLEDKLRLSCASSQLRSFLIPDVFRTLRFTNLRRDEAAITGVLSRFHQHVKKLCFQFHLFNLGRESDQESSRPSSNDAFKFLSETAARLLRGEALPKVGSIIVQFVPEEDFEQGDWGGGQSSIYTFESSETQQEAQERETQSPWRAVMKEAWESLETNPAIKSLEITSLPTVMSTAWCSDAWKDFLGRLEHLSLGVWGGDNGAGWEANTMDGYTDFLGTVTGRFFLDHLISTTDLSIVARANNPWGGEGMHHAPLPLTPQQLPNLQRLHLTHCIIDPPLTEFLASHATTLTELCLTGCTSCYGDNLADNGIPWSFFFTSLADSNPVLQNLTITYGVVPLTQDEWSPKPGMKDPETGAFIPPPDEAEPVRLLREKVKKQDGFILFPYITLDDKYGMVFENEDMNLESGQMGDDYAAYQRLWDIVQKNAENAVKAKSG